jgi:hypothetical protein
MEQSDLLEQGSNLAASPATAPISQPTNKTVTVEKIRPELNLEKWPIWQPSKSKTPPRGRVVEREITLPGGNKLNAAV